MSLVSWPATANQPVGIQSPFLPDLESDLPAGDSRLRCWLGKFASVVGRTVLEISVVPETTCTEFAQER